MADAAAAFAAVLDLPALDAYVVSPAFDALSGPLQLQFFKRQRYLRATSGEGAGRTAADLWQRSAVPS
jgi:hypothetical protein